MQRQAAIAILAAAVLVPGLQAQMRSGGGRGAPAMRGSAPGHGGFVGGHAGVPAGGHFGRSFRTSSGFHGGTWGHGGGWSSNRHRFVNRGFRNNACYNGYCGAGYAGYIAPPIFWSDYTAGYDTAGYADSQYVPATPAYDDSDLRMEIRQLTDQVEQLREEQQAHIRAQQTAAPAHPSRMGLPTVLVFRDGRVKEVNNYGIVGQTLWILDEQRARKVPLTELDLTATKGANEDRGGFVVPR